MSADGQADHGRVVALDRARPGPRRRPGWRSRRRARATRPCRGTSRAAASDRARNAHAGRRRQPAAPTVCVITQTAVRTTCARPPRAAQHGRRRPAVGAACRARGRRGSPRCRPRARRRPAGMPARAATSRGLGAGVARGGRRPPPTRGHHHAELDAQRAEQRPPLGRARREEDQRRPLEARGSAAPARGRRLGAVGAVDHVLAHLEREVAADGPGGRVQRGRSGPSSCAGPRSAPSPSTAIITTGPEVMKSTSSPKKGRSRCSP